MDTINITVKELTDNNWSLLFSAISAIMSIISVIVVWYGFKKFSRQKIKEHQFLTMKEIVNFYKSISITIKKVDNSTTSAEDLADNNLEIISLYGYYNIPSNFKNKQVYFCTEYIKQIERLESKISDCYFPKKIFEQVNKLFDVSGIYKIDNTIPMTGILVGKPSNQFTGRDYYCISNNQSYSNAFCFFETLNLTTEAIYEWFKNEQVHDIINIKSLQNSQKQEIFNTMDINQIKSIIGQSIASPFLQNLEYKDNSLVINVSDITNEDKSYLSTGDKINKILAIESYRWFCKIPQLTILQLEIQSASKGVFKLNITREAIEEYYGSCGRFIAREWNNIKLNSSWAGEFLNNNDSKDSRQRFCTQFVNS